MTELPATSNHTNVVRDCVLDAGINSGGVRGAPYRSAVRQFVRLLVIVASENRDHTTVIPAE